MSKTNYFKRSLIIMTVCLVIDFFLKFKMQTSENISYNQGLFLGYYAHVPQSLKVILLSTFSGFLFSIYVFLIFILPKRLYLLKVGASLLMGGVFGNVVDQMLHGRTLDFIPFKLFGNQFYFNSADVFQWCGFFIIIFVLFKYENLIWHPKAHRKQYFINPKEQIKAALVMSSVSFCGCLLLGLFCYTYMKSYIPINAFKTELLLTFLCSYLFLSMLFTLLVFCVGLIISHRTAGPLYAFELYVKDLLEGERGELVLREGDNYRELEKVALKLKRKFKEFD